MSSRLAACEACRKTKLACDHKRPACTRCENSNRAGICIYRVSPFKRKRTTDPDHLGASSRVSYLDSQADLAISPRLNPYPNPGYFGSSSHTTIFHHISADHAPVSITGDDSEAGLSLPSCYQIVDENALTEGAKNLLLITEEYKLSAMEDLVLFWLAKGANLALAEPFVELCTRNVIQLFASVSQDIDWHLACARLLLQNSTKPFIHNANTSLREYSAQMLDANFRWEALGIFFLAVSRATVDIAFFPKLYMTREKRYSLQRFATKLSDCALDITLSLDCLNDIQLILQYENFIMHSFLDVSLSLQLPLDTDTHYFKGYSSWRKIGDVISSIFAIGYHEDIDAKPDVPFFLAQLRKTAFARIFSADKNVSTFLGRPPRMSKRFSNFQIPSSFPAPQQNLDTWDPDQDASFLAETRWSALCAFLKEEILELARDKIIEGRSERIGAIKLRAEEQWEALPSQLRLERSSPNSDHHSPFQKDFLFSTRLNHLHVLFLLRLLMPSTLSEPDNTIIEIAGEMLSLVVELILARDQIVNSGTSLVWKVAHYGLPAAGMMVIAMLGQRNTPMPAGMSRTRVLQDMSLYVAEIQRGTIVNTGDPIYVLLSKATETIQRLLDSFYCGSPDINLGERYEGQGEVEDWTTMLGQDL
ncbi:uncharacterized protein N7506_001641 [Penicillium brevicompactum]|uniref:uncharacterized protein n=1 Tax=Penicillium brevicompactum TaxID=5074 RepID=UPI00254094D2|nr:uncharacterized protein N7506_001641 [Penicillium brevicompactum]KAJ5348388.1 hypothetical protein N7506_001641 [Penicillium brevicompactum]